MQKWGPGRKRVQRAKGFNEQRRGLPRQGGLPPWGASFGVHPSPRPGRAASAPARPTRGAQPAGLTGRPASPARRPRAQRGGRGGRGGPTAVAPAPPQAQPSAPALTTSAATAATAAATAAPAGRGRGQPGGCAKPRPHLRPMGSPRSRHGPAPSARLVAE